MTSEPVPDPLAADMNPYEAPKALIVRVDEADPRGVAVFQRVLLVSFGIEVASFVLAAVFSMLEIQTRSVAGATFRLATLLAIMVVFWLGWLLLFGSVLSLTSRLKGGWSGWLIAAVSFIPIYGIPLAWLVNLRASQFLKSKGYKAGWFGTRLDQFRKDSSKRPG